MKRFKILLFLIMAVLIAQSSVFAQATVTATPTIAAPAPTPLPLFSGAKPMYLGGAPSTVASASVASFFAVQGSSTVKVLATEGDVQTPVPAPGHIRNLYCILTDATGLPTVAGGTNYVLGLRLQSPANGTAAVTTALACTIGAAAVACSDVTDDVYVGSGMLIDFIATPSGTPTALITHCTAELDM